MSKYKYLLWDLDGTIIDFLAAEKEAIKALFLKYGFGPCSDQAVAAYSKINVKYWEALERNEMTKPEILVGRFKEFFELMGLPVEMAEAFNADYQLALGDSIVFNDNAKALLEDLKNDYVQAVVTNGTKDAQDKKLARSGLLDLFDYIFISEEVGAEKPNEVFFQRIFKEMGIEDMSEVLIIGDSLTSDIRGGNNVGIDTCWYNPEHVENTKKAKVTYEISHLWSMKIILED